MRIVVDRGSNAGSVMGYLLRTDKREKGREDENPVIHTNMFGEGEQELTEELRFSADQNHRVEKTYVQYKVSFPPGENPDLQTKIGIVDDLLEMRGHGHNCQFFAVEHFEKIDKQDVHHLHVLASTVRLDGSWVDDAYERVKLKDVERAIEQKRKLQECAPKPKGQRTNTSIREVKLREQGQLLTKDTLRAVIDEAIQDQPSMPLLMTRIKTLGLTMQFHEFKDGKGISFGAEGQYFKGRQLGDRFSFNGLHEYAGVDYQPQRDDPMLRQLNQMSAEQCQTMLNPSEEPESDQVEPDEEIQQPIRWDATCLVEEIWQLARQGGPKRENTTFENYQIRADEEGHPELYRDQEKVLISQGFTQNEVECLQNWRQRMTQQAEDQEKKGTKEQEQQTTIQPDKLKEKSKGLER